MSRLGLVVHTLLAFALLGAAIHLVVAAVKVARGAPRPRSLPLFARVVGWLYGLTLGVGALVYPAYRYVVAGLYLSRHAPWAANLFDFKECLAALGLPWAFGLVRLARHPAPGDRQVRLAFAVCSVGLAVVVLAATVFGLWVTAERGV